METRVTYRASEETVKRLQELSVKYGVSQSALLTMLVNDRWLSENSPRVNQVIAPPVRKVNKSSIDLEPPPNFPEYVQPVVGGKKKRRRR